MVFISITHRLRFLDLFPEKKNFIDAQKREKQKYRARRSLLSCKKKREKKRVCYLSQPTVTQNRYKHDPQLDGQEATNFC
jgi:hypothetical protein